MICEDMYFQFTYIDPDPARDDLTLSFGIDSSSSRQSRYSTSIPSREVCHIVCKIFGRLSQSTTGGKSEDGNDTAEAHLPSMARGTTPYHRPLSAAPEVRRVDFGNTWRPKSAPSMALRNVDGETQYPQVWKTYGN